MKQFDVHWLSGRTEKVKGETIQSALSGAGYPTQAMSEVDFFTEEEIVSQSVLLRNDQYPYICNNCEEDWWSDSHDGRCPICRRGHLVPKTLYHKDKAKGA